jgi:sugar O-acyltransferase (sialic acid O-acetyltransferase NeuD family)
MIKQIFLPKLDANTVEVYIRSWYKKEKESVAKGEALLAIETDKAVIDVESEDSGVVLKVMAQENMCVPIPCVAGLMGDSIEELDSAELNKAIGEFSAPVIKTPQEVVARAPEIRMQTGRVPTASPAARHLAKEKGVDLAQLTGSGGRGEITAKDIMAFVETGRKSPVSVGPPGPKRRVLVIGAGDGGYIVSEVLGFEPTKYEIIGFLDDNQKLWGQELHGHRVLGGTDRVIALGEQGLFDSLIISITANMRVRRKLFEEYRALGFTCINAIHPSVHVSPSAKIGCGNLIYGMVYIGTETRVGDNNLISAHSSIDHHNVVGSHNLFGPGCLTSGAVTIGDSCIFGAGVGIEPHLRIGNNVKIASGLAISSHVADGVVLKSHFSVGV